MHKVFCLPPAGFFAGRPPGAALLVIAALAAQPAGAQTAPTRPQVQHLLWRFAFSAPPASLTATLSSGMPPWLAAQENGSALDDSNTGLEILPTALVGGGYPDWNIFERAVMQAGEGRRSGDHVSLRPDGARQRAGQFRNAAHGEFL